MAMRRAQWATVVARQLPGRPPPGPFGNRGPQGEEQYEAMEEARMAAAAAMAERREVAQKRKKEFMLTMEIEQHRRRAGKDFKNYIMLLHTGNDKTVEYEYAAKMLAEVGLKDSDIFGLNKDPYRPAALEVILKQDAMVDIGEINRKIHDLNYPFEANMFGHCLETLVVDGMPLTNDVENMTNMIKYAIKPYVREVSNVTPSKHRVAREKKTDMTDKFFEGKYDGSYRVQVVPKEDAACPQFISIGPDHIMGQVRYVKGGSNFHQQCNLCFAVGHFRNECNEVGKWVEYARKQREDGRRILADAGIVVSLTPKELLEKRIKEIEEELGNAKAFLQEEKKNGKERV